MEEYAREPCPWRIVDDCGGAFTIGTIGGGIFQAFKGFRNSPVAFPNGPQFAEDHSQLPSNQLPSSPFGDYRQYQ
ncbi:mitochondrial import inner membrane translocase subunit Tim17-A [Sigmodon hispidus]